jgi:hypothetical protein
VTLGATLAASLLVAISRPSTWPLGLLGFLVRGGLLLVIAPILVLPTAVGVGTVVAPLLEDVAFGRRTAELAGLGALVLATVVTWFLVGGLLAARAEVELIVEVTADDEFPVTPSPPDAAQAPGRAWRIVAVRAVAHVPLLIALAWAGIRVVSVAYRELTVPSDVAVPLEVRVLAGTPDAIVLVVLAWLVGETLGALAARRIVLLGEGVPAALRGAFRRFLRHPVRGLGLAAVTTVVLAVVLIAMGLASGAAWSGLRDQLGAGDVSGLAFGLLAVFVALFLAGLVLLGVTTAWRAAVWTVESAGTFGGGSGVPTGD